jgi:Amt family ammonium transporter
MIFTGIFASKAVNAAGNDGLFYGNASFFITQLKAMFISVGYSFSVSYLIFKFINFVLPLRVTEKEEELGLDATQHNEAYVQGTLIVQKEGKETSIIIEKGTVEEIELV